MGYLNELLSRNPLVIDGGTIRPHHNYTDDLYTGGNHKITNYDRIKSMSVEEMAETFNYLAESCGDISGTCNGCIMYVKKGMSDNCHKLTCTEVIKQWLLQGVSENDTTRKES